MHTIEQALFNNLPEQNKPGQSGFKLQVNTIDQWFDTLPMANIRTSTKSIYNALKETNGYKAPYKKRLYFLEKIHQSVAELASNLKNLNLNRELPLDEKHQRIAILMYKLHKKVSIGYKLVLQDLMNCQLFFLCPAKRKLMTLVISRIIRHNSLALIANYQLYNTPQKGLWSDLHHLFLLAYQEKLLSRKITDPSLQLVKETTIKNAYLQILLVAVADPYRMAQHQTYSIFRHLEEWSALADLHKYLDSDTKDSLAIDLSKDTHPSFIALQDIQDKNFAWVLNTSKLDYAHLIEHFDTPEIQTSEVNVDLLKQLSLAWGIAPGRQHSRRSSGSKLKVAIGLNNVHYVLNGYAEPEWMKAEGSEYDNKLALSENSHAVASYNSRPIVSTVKVNDIWGEVFNSKTPAKKQTIKPNNTSMQKKPEPHTPQQWGMVNESIGGYCLLWDQGDSVNAKVGEIIAISHEEEKKEGYWLIATIRWMKCIDGDKIQIGAQILAPNAIAVSIAKYSSMQEGLKSRAIMLPAIPVLKQPKTLITTALGYETRDQVILDEYRLVNANITSFKSKVILLDTLEISCHFSRFKYSLAENFYATGTKNSSSQQASRDTLSLDGDTDFDSIWDDL